MNRFLNQWKKIFSAVGLRVQGPSEKQRRRAAQSYRPQLEPLEPRQLLTATAADSGDTVTIIDDGDTNFSVSGDFVPQSNAQVSAAYDGDNHNMRGGEGTATWTFTNVADGEYQVAATWAHKYGNRYNAPDAPFTLRDGETQRSQVLVDQQNLPAEFIDEQEVTWDTLDTISVTSGTLRVELSEAPGNNYVVADAIRIERTGDVSSGLSVVIADDSVSEADGATATTATVMRSGSTSGDLIVNLASDNVSEAAVPSSVTILNGKSSASFEIAAVDDGDADGTQTVTISAAATGYTAGSDTLEVTDDEADLVTILDNGDVGFSQDGFTRLSNSQVTSAYDGDNHNMQGGSGTATWTFTNVADGEYQVAATWAHKYGNRYNALDAPFDIKNGSETVLASAIVNQKDSPSGFEYGGYNWDTLGTVNVSDGTLVVTLGAGTQSNQYSVADAIRIERLGEITPTLTVAISADSISESAGPAATTATVTRTDTNGAVEVSLASDNANEATVPATVTIPDGQSSVTFEIAAIDDAAADGAQTVTISATATGYADGSDTLEVTDDEADLVTILDNGDVGFSQDGFTYLSNSQVSHAYDGDNHNMRGGSGTATWAFLDLDDGEYRVAATWAHRYNNNYNAEDAPFTITDGSGSVLASAIVNQKNIPSEFAYEGYTWDSLGTVSVTDGTLEVTLGAGSNSNKFTVADAIRIERILPIVPTAVGDSYVVRRDTSFTVPALGTSTIVTDGLALNYQAAQGANTETLWQQLQQPIDGQPMDWILTGATLRDEDVSNYPTLTAAYELSDVGSGSGGTLGGDPNASWASLLSESSNESASIETWFKVDTTDWSNLDGKYVIWETGGTDSGAALTLDQEGLLEFQVRHDDPNHGVAEARVTYDLDQDDDGQIDFTDFIQTVAVIDLQASHSRIRLYVNGIEAVGVSPDPYATYSPANLDGTWDAPDWSNEQGTGLGMVAGLLGGRDPDPTIVSLQGELAAFRYYQDKPLYLAEIQQNYDAVTRVSPLENDINPNPLPMTAALVTSPENGQIAFNSDGSFTYIPAPGFHGTDSFTYEARVNPVSPPATVHLEVLNQRQYTLKSVIRDFNPENPDLVGYGSEGRHPDFERQLDTVVGIQDGVVASQLNEQGKPTIHADANLGAAQIESSERFDEWFSDVSPSRTKSHDLVLTETSPESGIFRYASRSFFPIDGQLLGDSPNYHNYHFTLEAAGEFIYNDGSTDSTKATYFEIQSDDDAYFFVDNKIALELGGVHVVNDIPRRTSLASLGLEDGERYSFNLFYAERQTIDAELIFETNAEFAEPPLSVDITGHQPGTLSSPGSEVNEDDEEDLGELVVGVNDDNDAGAEPYARDNSDQTVHQDDNDMVKLTLDATIPNSMTSGTIKFVVHESAKVNVFSSDGSALLSSGTPDGDNMVFELDLASPSGSPLEDLMDGPMDVYAEALDIGGDIFFELIVAPEASSGLTSASDKVLLTVVDTDIIIHRAGTSAAPGAAISEENEDKLSETVAGVNVDHDDGIKVGGVHAYDNEDTEIKATDNDIVKLTLETDLPTSLAEGVVRFIASNESNVQIFKPDGTALLAGGQVDGDKIIFEVDLAYPTGDLAPLATAGTIDLFVEGMEEGDTTFQLAYDPIPNEVTVVDQVFLELINPDLRTNSDHDSDFDEEDDRREEKDPGRIVGVNSDDDDGNGTPDKADGPAAANENNLVKTKLTVPTDSKLNGFEVRLEASQGGGLIKAWTTAQKATEIALPKTYTIGTDTVPTEIFIEGLADGTAILDVVVEYPDHTEVVRDKVVFTIVEIKLNNLEFEDNFTISKDDGTGAFVGDDYLDANEDGDGKDAPGDHEYPVGYVRDTKIKVGKAFFKFGGATIDSSHSSVIVRGKATGNSATGSDIYELEDVTVDLGGNISIQVEDILAKTELANTVLYYEEFFIDWEFSFDGEETWVPAGRSTNQLYATLDSPVPPAPPLPGATMYHTVVHLSSMNAHGMTTENDAITAIWSEFTDRDVRRVDGTQLTYYDNYTCTNLDTASLITNGDGQCGSWAALFLDTLMVQGINRADDYVLVERDPALVFPAIDPKNQGFIVNDWSFAGAGTSDAAINRVPGTLLDSLVTEYSYLNLWKKDAAGGYTQFNATGDGYEWEFEDVSDGNGVAGQGNANPASSFNNHQFVQLDVGAGNVWYDPSYGTTYTGELDFDDNYLSGYFVTLLVDVTESAVDIDLNGNGDKADEVEWLVTMFKKNTTGVNEVSATFGNFPFP